MTRKLAVLLGLLAAATSIAGSANAADPALERAAAALRVDDLKSVHYAGDGWGWTFGQAYKPGEA